MLNLLISLWEISSKIILDTAELKMDTVIDPEKKFQGNKRCEHLLNYIWFYLHTYILSWVQKMNGTIVLKIWANFKERMLLKYSIRKWFATTWRSFYLMNMVYRSLPSTSWLKDLMDNRAVASNLAMRVDFLSKEQMGSWR